MAQSCGLRFKGGVARARKSSKWIFVSTACCSVVSATAAKIPTSLHRLRCCCRLSPKKLLRKLHKCFRIAFWRRNSLQPPFVPFVSLRHRRPFPFVVIFDNTGLSSCEVLLESTLIKSSQHRYSLLYPGRLPLHPNSTATSHRAIKRQVPPVRDP
jgi:hypothetical protein